MLLFKNKFSGSIPDYPPPSFDEAVAAAAAARNAPPISPADSTTTNSSFSDTYQAAPILIPPVPRSQNQPVVARTLPDPELSESLRYSTQADYDSDEDLELISTSEATPSVGSWEQDPHMRVFPERAHLEVGTAPTSARTLRSSPSQLTLTPQLSESLQDGGDDIFASSPSTDSQGDDHTDEPHNPTPSSGPPKRRLHLLSGLLKARDHPASVPSTPTHAAASQLSLPFLNRPGSPSKSHRGEGLISRKLFGHKGKDRSVEPQIGGPPEPLETWDMLSDVERDAPPTPGSSYPTPPVSSASEYSPGTSRRFDSTIHLLPPGLRREGTRPKHLSMLNPPVPPPTLPLTPTATQRSNTHTDPRAAAALVSAQRQPTFAVSATASASAAVPSPSSPSQRLPVRSTQALLNTSAVVDSPTRGRSLRATASMIWNPGRRPSPVASPTRSTTTPISPSSASLQSSVTNVDYDAATPATLVGHDGQEAILGTLHSSLVQEEEEENFVTPPGSPARSPSTLPIPAINSRHPSPVRHEGRIGVSLRDEGPVPPVSPSRSESHARAARTPTITPRPSINALHAFAPPNPSPLSNQSFERQALMPPLPPSPTLENSDPPKRDTVLSIGDTESLIDLYVHSGPAPTSSTASSTVPAASIDNELDQQMPASSGDPMHHHYPGRPLPHPPGASQSGPVQPVLLDAFLGGNIPGGLPAYEEVEPERQGIWQFLPFSQAKPVSNAPCLPPAPLVNQPGPCTPPRRAPPELFTVFDEDAFEPSSPGSTYETPSTPSSTQREFADVPDEDDVFETTTTTATSSHHREARHLHSLALPSYCIADRRSPTPAEPVSRAGSQVGRAHGVDAPQDYSCDDGCDDHDEYEYADGCAVQREWGTAGARRGSAQTGDAQWAREAQAGTAWLDRRPVRDVRDAVPRP